MTDYPYGALPNAYLNVKEAAKAPWRGITAWIQGMPYLVIDRDGEGYIIEGEDGQTYTAENGEFERWEPATEHSSLVAASRLEGSPFEAGEKLGHYPIGNLVFFEHEWHVHIGESSAALPLEKLVEHFDARRWSRTADLLPDMDYRCPECGSRNVHLTDDSFMTEPSSEWGGTHAYTCDDCGYEGPEREFEDEEPDYDGHHHDDYGDDNFYRDMLGMDSYNSSVKTADDDEPQYTGDDEGVGDHGAYTFTWHSPGRAGIHGGTFRIFQQAGLHATATYPPGTSEEHPEGLSLEIPGSNPMEALMIQMDYEMGGGGSLTELPIEISTSDDPAQVKRYLDGASHGARDIKDLDRMTKRLADSINQENEPTLDQKKGVRCPNCGSHTIRSYSPEGNEATLVCLTCGNEFKREVHINPESKVAVAPVDPNLHATILGITQQIQQASAMGNHALVQQLNQQLQQLLQNPNAPAPAPTAQPTTTAGTKESNKYIKKRGDQWCIIQKGTGKELSCHDSEEKAESAFRAMEMHMHGSMQKEAPGNEHLPYATPKRNRQYEHVLQSCHEEHPDWSEDRCKELAARTVNKERRKKHELKGESHVDEDCGCSDEKVVIGNDNLPDSQENYFLETLTFEPHQADSTYPDYGSDPYGGQQVDLDQYTADEPDDRGIDYAHCPACDGPGVLLGQLGKRIHYRCRNCGIDFSHNIDEAGDQNPNELGPQRTEPFGQYGSYDEAKKVNQNTLRAFKDSSGNPLEAGKLYHLRHPNYKVPDLVKILNLENDRVEAAIASDEHNSFPIHITHEDAYSLDPYEEKTASGWNVVKEARSNLSAQEQRELIEENKNGRARNIDKLNLDGTHYRIEETDPEFLLGS